jgi:peptide deformylase
MLERLVHCHFPFSRMAIRTILRMGDARLLRQARPVAAFDTPALHQLIADMRDTMAAANGAGLAAPQIGEDWQVVIFGSQTANPRYPDRPLVPPTVLINPRIEALDAQEEEDWEGCLSVPGLRGKVPRWSRIRYWGYDPTGEPIDRVAEGFHARVVQHECDHLIGKLYPMRMRDFTQFGYTDVLFPGIAEPQDD